MKYLFLLLFSISANAAIINQPTPQPSDYPTITHTRVSQQTTQLFNALKSGLSQMYRMAWSDPRHSAADYFGALGSDSCMAHMLYSSEASILNGAIAGSVPVEPCAVTCNQDGSVNVVCPSPSASPSP